jgi:hypothetical protein
MVSCDRNFAFGRREEHSEKPMQSGNGQIGESPKPYTPVEEVTDAVLRPEFFWNKIPVF